MATPDNTIIVNRSLFEQVCVFCGVMSS